MDKTKDQISWVLSHDLYWENKMYKRKRSIKLQKSQNKENQWRKGSYPGSCNRMYFWFTARCAYNREGRVVNEGGGGGGGRGGGLNMVPQLHAAYSK